MAYDYEKLELMIGLEIHRQLDTRKLFCRCPSNLMDIFDCEFHRTLHPSQSEMGEVDAAALKEADKKNTYVYQASKKYSCLVDCDEEPPKGPDEEAFHTSIEIATMMNAMIPPRIHFMRKIVIDGSNTSGFQRTALVGVDGYIEVGGKRIGIDTLCLEEDSARKIERKEGKVTYRLDRLGIPLIEVATAPDMKTPEEAKDVARTIGNLLRSTRMVRRGLGTIRQDVNVSIKGSARVEIKGFQELPSMPQVIDFETGRHIFLQKLQSELDARGSAEELAFVPVDVTDIFEGSESRMVADALKRKETVIALKLKHFAGLLGMENEYGYRFGKELAQHAMVFGFKGLFHGDEMPNYGITDEDISSIKERLDINGNDSYVLILGQEKQAKVALQDIFDRAKKGWNGVVKEVRKVVDLETRYMRPMSGSARMYPETDIPPVHVSPDMKRGIDNNLPEMLDDTIERLTTIYGLGSDMVSQLVKKGTDHLLDRMMLKTAIERGDLGTSSDIVLVSDVRRMARSPDHSDIMKKEGYRDIASRYCRYLLHSLSEARKAGFENDKVADDVFIYHVKAGTPWDSITDLLIYTLKNDVPVEEAVAAGGFEKAADDQVRNICRRIVEEKKDFISDKGAAAIGPLMGVVMKELKGKADGKLASALLKEEIERLLGK